MSIIAIGGILMDADGTRNKAGHVRVYFFDDTRYPFFIKFDPIK